ncbi:hypothetical protein GCM10010218_44550 [Streptomyces mashuensis]|uniref:Sortase n=2 Tax=Streptomyces mashuensis TaxID=33904 RepID=A0A919B5K8_9ACTN|nr:hypothetical protein GCM10010218_44550 [Streptomyces mashuensis]
MLAGAAATAAVLGLPVAPAFADNFGKLEISPGTAQPGGTVTVNTTACGADGHATADASAVGGPASFELKPGTHKEVVVGQFDVPRSAKPGTYGIGAKCSNGKEATGDLIVKATGGGKTSGGNTSGGKEAGTGGKESPMPRTSHSSSPMPPRGGMKTGLGGTNDDSGTVEIVAGAAVLGAVAVAGTWFLRRRGGSDRV